MSIYKVETKCVITEYLFCTCIMLLYWWVLVCWSAKVDNINFIFVLRLRQIVDQQVGLLLYCQIILLINKNWQHEFNIFRLRRTLNRLGWSEEMIWLLKWFVRCILDNASVLINTVVDQWKLTIQA